MDPFPMRSMLNDSIFIHSCSPFLFQFSIIPMQFRFVKRFPIKLGMTGYVINFLVYNPTIIFFFISVGINYFKDFGFIF